MDRLDRATLEHIDLGSIVEDSAVVCWKDFYRHASRTTETIRTNADDIAGGEVVESCGRAGGQERSDMPDPHPGGFSPR